MLSALIEQGACEACPKCDFPRPACAQRASSGWMSSTPEKTGTGPEEKLSRLLMALFTKDSQESSTSTRGLNPC